MLVSKTLGKTPHFSRVFTHILHTKIVSKTQQARVFTQCIVKYRQHLLRWARIFTCVLHTNMLVSKTRGKMPCFSRVFTRILHTKMLLSKTQEKREENKKRK